MPQKKIRIDQVEAHNHDNLYYRQATLDAFFESKIPYGGTEGQFLAAHNDGSRSWETVAVPTLTKEAVGLGNVDNTSDAAKPVSTAQATAINALKSSIVHAVFDNGDDTLFDGMELSMVMPFSGTIDGWTLLASHTGSLTVSVSRTTYATYPTLTAIDGTERPTLTNAFKNQDTSLTTWTRAFSANDVLYFRVLSPTNVKRLTLALNVTRS